MKGRKGVVDRRRKLL